MTGWISTALLSATLAQPLGGPGGFGGFGGPPGGETRKLVEKFDADKDGKLNAAERAEARKTSAQGGGRRGGPGGGFGGPPGMGRGPEPKPGAKIAPGDVANFPGKPLYDGSTLRTLFIHFENTTDWEKELEDFYHTDVDVPCSLTVDGKTYKDVGVHFRGSSSYFGVRSGSKRSLNISMDYADDKQRLYGSKTLNLLNGHDDSTFLSSVLYSHISSAHMPTPAANFVRVVINGESWGIYSNVQQFDKEFLQQHYKTTKGTRWKVKGSPGGRGGLEYFGEDVEAYKKVFAIKSKDDPKAWKALINLCKVLNQTPVDQLEAKLAPLVDLDSFLWFLACDVALINCDGYWIRASDYNLYLDEKGKFHIVPHDMNECFRQPMGPGLGGVRGGPGMMGGIMIPPPMGEVVPAFLRNLLELKSDQTAKLDALQKEVDATIEALLTPEQRKQWKEMKSASPPMGMPGGPGGGFGGPPVGFGGPPMMAGVGGGAGGLALDPLTGLDDARKPLRSKLLNVPAWRTKYLQNIHTIANEQLDWKKLGPTVAAYRKLLDADIKADTKKLSTYESFIALTADAPAESRGRETTLRKFADQRRAALLNNAEVKKAIR
jgi:hypothetical protein